MAYFSTSKPSSCSYNNRSVSLQPRSHPSMVILEEKLKKIRLVEASNTAATCIKGLSCLAELYMCIEEILNLPSTQQALSQQCKNELWITELLEYSVKYLDICNNIKDALLTMKESVRELQSAIRRSRTGELSVEINVDAFYCTRKNFKKIITKFKQTGKKVGTLPWLSIDDHHISAMVRVLREASMITGSIFNSLLTYLSVLDMKRHKPSRWSFVSKLLHKGAVASEGQQLVNVNELESMDIALGNLVQQEDLNTDSGLQKCQSAYERLQALDVCFESLENGLERMNRHLICTRVSLLNAVSY